MANYNKSFNFRNGVQVDDDNFIVNANGLVGIGTSIPREFLDVHGTAKITGLVTATNLTITGVSTFYSNVGVGTAITFNSSTGIISATSFYGDGQYLLNVEQVAVDGWIVNAGSISTTAKVGIGTTLPSSQLDVLGDAKISGITTFTGLVDANGGATIDNIQIGVTGDNEIDTSSGNLTIDSAGGITTIDDNLIVTGSITGNVTGNVVGNVTGNVNSSGVSTFSGGIQGNVTGNVAGNVTGNVAGNVTGNVVGNVTGNVNSSGVSTFSGGIQGNVTGNVAGNVTGNVTGNLTGNVNSSGVSTFSGGIQGNVTGNVTGNVIGSATSLTQNATVNINNLTVGVATVSTRLYAEQIGVGTNSPSSDIHLRRSSASRLQVTSDTAEAIVAVGRSTTLTENNGALIFGNTAGIYPYSDSRTLDIVNYSTGNLNAYLHYGSAGVGTGNFNWIYGKDPTNPLMSLTYEGNLGLGVTNPAVKLQVSGIASVTSLVTEDITATTNIVATGAGTSTSVQTLYVYGGRSQILNSNGTEIFPAGDDNVNITSGISTFFNIKVTNNAIFNGNIGIGTTNPQYPIQIGDYSGDVENSVVISQYGIGLGTDITGSQFFLDALGKDSVFGAVSIGSTEDKTKVGGGNGFRVFHVKGLSEFDGNVGIGTTNPTSSLTVRDGDISVGINTSNGLVLTSANGTKYRLFVSNAGVLSTVLVP
jgi:trimeric autotransporter adhesin